MFEIAPKVCPGLTWELDENGDEVFEGPDGFHAIGRTDPVGTFDPFETQPYCLELVDEGDVLNVSPNPLIEFEMSYVPRVLPASFDYKTPTYWDEDKKPWTAGTGGTRRNFVSVPLAKALREGRMKWFLAEYEFNKDQCNRPLCHNPFVVSGDQYSKKTVNAGTDREWKHDQINANGWNGFDTAHADYARISSLAGLGVNLAVVNAFLVWRWYVRSAGDTTNWMTQPRSGAWTLNWGLVAHYLGLQDPYNTDGLWKKPRVAVKDWCRNMVGPLGDQYLFQSMNKPDGRSAPWLPDDDWNGYGPQVVGAQMFHFALMMWGILRVIDSKILEPDSEGLVPQLQALAKTTIGWFEEGMEVEWANQPRFAWFYGATLFTSYADCQKLVNEANAAKGKVEYEVRNVPGGYRLMSIPQESTTELWPYVIARFSDQGLDHPFVQAYLKGNRYGQFLQYDLPLARLVEDNT